MNAPDLQWHPICSPRGRAGWVGMGGWCRDYLHCTGDPRICSPSEFVRRDGENTLAAILRLSDMTWNVWPNNPTHPSPHANRRLVMMMMSFICTIPYTQDHSFWVVPGTDVTMCTIHACGLATMLIKLKDRLYHSSCSWIVLCSQGNICTF